MFAATPFVICHNLGFIGGQKTREDRSRGKGGLVTSQPTSDVICVIFLMHAQTVDTRLSFPPTPALEPGDEARLGHANEIAMSTYLLLTVPLY